MTLYFSDTLNILSSVEEVKEFPYPFGKTYTCIPRDLYQLLADNRPFIPCSGNNKRSNMYASEIISGHNVHPLWKDFAVYHTSQNFYHSILKKFGRYFKEFYPQYNFDQFKCGIRNSGDIADIYLDCQICINSPVTKKSTVSVPHLDEPHEVWAALFYMREQDDHAGGDLIIHKYRQIPVMMGKRCIDPNDLIDVDIMKYEPNALVCFMNSAISVHSVTEREVTNKCRMFCNINLELPSNSPELFNLLRFP